MNDEMMEKKVAEKMMRGGGRALPPLGGGLHQNPMLKKAAKEAAKVASRAVPRRMGGQPRRTVR